MAAKKKNSKVVELTPRDKRVILEVFLHRFMTAEQIALTIDAKWNRTNLRNRLTALTDARYLDRPRSQKGRFREGGGRFPMIYALGTSGASLLSETPYNRNLKKISFTTKNQSIKQENIEHGVMMTNVVVQARLACNNNGLTFLDEDELIRSISKEGRKIERGCGARGWRVPAAHGYLDESARIIPDRMFAFEFPHLPEGKNRLYFFLEADNGKESQVSRDPKRATIARKMRQYRLTAKLQLLEEHFPAITNFAVLFVTRGERRQRNMHTVDGHVTEGWSKFWFCSYEHVENMPFFDIPWLKGGDDSTQTLTQFITSLLTSDQ